MYEHSTEVRVRYGDTDQMGVVYYGNYPLFYEQGRTECMRSLGLAYTELEKRGVMMPITRMNVRYIKPALYDEILTIKTFILEMPSRLITFKYKIFNPAGELINEAETQLIFLYMDTKKIAYAPDEMLEALGKFFK